MSNVGDSRAVLGTTVPRRAQFGANGSLGGGGSVQLNAALTGAVGNLSTVSSVAYIANLCEADV